MIEGEGLDRRVAKVVGGAKVVKEGAKGCGTAWGEEDPRFEVAMQRHRCQQLQKRRRWERMQA